MSGNLISANQAGLTRAAEILRHGGVVVIPTDTVYGLVANPRKPEAVERIYGIKRRERGKPLQLLVSGIEEMEKFGAALGPGEKAVAKAFWPGPLTLVVRTNEATEGFRVPSCPLALGIIGLAGGVLRATSANISGREPATSAEGVWRDIGDQVDLVLDGGVLETGGASTVARINDDGVIEILREGVISLAEMQAVL